MLPRDRAHARQVREIDAGNQEDEAGNTGQDEKGTREV